MKRLMPYIMLLPLLLGTCLPGSSQGQMLSARDDFAGYAAGSDGSPNWLTTSLGWTVRGGAYQFDGSLPGFAVWGEGPVFGKLSLQATLRLTGSPSDSWDIAGISVYTDDQHFWHLALVQAPEANAKRHYVELAEMLDGQWPVQNQLQQVLNESHADPAWEYNVPYRMGIELTADGITGTISDLSGRALHRIGYRFSARAVTRGRPALHVGGFNGSFDDVVAEASDAMPPPIPPKAPAYGVASSGKSIGEAKGYFQVKRVDGIWWAVDPEGRAFYGVGTDHCRYGGHWCEKLGYAPYGRNMEKKFGSPEAWAKSATDGLKAWNFNLLGAGGDPTARYRGLAHTDFVAFGSTFSSISDICPKIDWTGFPNVFDPRWEAYCSQLARRVCRPQKDDPWLFGYFLDNELEWYGKTGAPSGLFDEAMKKPADHSAKVALVDFLRKRYPSIDAFSRAWGVKAGSFDDLLKLGALSDGGREELRQVKLDFVRLVADRYFAVTTAAIRKQDANHLILGCRFAGDAPVPAWNAAGKYCDIVSFNYYGNVDVETGEAPGLAERFTGYFAQAGRPLMITEWSFPALDGGLPCKHGAGQRFDTQTQRAQAYEIFQTLVLSLPFMVGSDYFMWVDEPALGIATTFPEDSNYGLVNEQDVPYPELTRTAQRVNAQAYTLHERGLVRLQAGHIRETERALHAEVWNNSGQAVTADVLVAVDGKTDLRHMNLPIGASPLVFNKSAQPGGHLVVLEIDPDRRLTLLTRANNRQAVAYYVPGMEPPKPPGGARAIPVVVANPSREAIPGFLATVSAKPLADELTFAVPGLPALSVTTCFVPVPGQQAAGGARFGAFEQTAGGYSFRAGGVELRKDKPSGDIVDEIVVDGVTLGRYNPLIWQDPGQNMWVSTDHFDSVKAEQSASRTVLVLTATGGRAAPITTVDEAGKQAALAQTPVPFRVTHQIIVDPSLPNGFQARFVSLENLGDRPLVLKGYFFYLLSAIGGDQAGDEPATPDVPNYYAGGQGAWRDPKVGWIFGAEPWPGSDLQVTFFRDAGGGEHPDARKQFADPIVIQPGGKYTEPNAPLLTVYGAEAGGTPWRDIQKRLRQQAAVVVRAFPPAK